MAIFNTFAGLEVLSALMGLVCLAGGITWALVALIQAIAAKRRSQ